MSEVTTMDALREAKEKKPYNVECKICKKEIVINNQRQQQFFCSKKCRNVRHNYVFEKGGRIIMNRYINLGNKYFFMNVEKAKTV